MKAYLRKHKFANLRGELERLRNDHLTAENMKALKQSIRKLIKHVLSYTDIVVCTFHMTQTLYHKQLFNPQVVWIDEASRENEVQINFVQLQLAPLPLILTGNTEQEPPFCLSTSVSPNNIDQRNCRPDQCL